LSSKPDYITLSGSGEPTLALQMDILIRRIKEITGIPVAVLTNGSLLWREDVRRELMHADLVIPSLDAGDESSFHSVNRPHKEISFERMLDGLIRFRHQFRGAYWLEVFVLGASTAVSAEFSKIVKCVNRIQPDRVQLNTVTRPPAEKCAVAVSHRRLAQLASRFDPPAEVIAKYDVPDQHLDFAASRGEILDLLRRRPCSLGDIAEGLGMHRNEAIKHVEELRAAGLLGESVVGGATYYVWLDNRLDTG
jgi:wyosine [tRNA(Phe)-imidazoG37] synthetase (radical SAM superfamily)